MPETLKISSIFPKHLFWDMDYDLLNFQTDMDIIIPRALYMTDESTFDTDIKKLENIYTPTQIVQQLKNTKEKVSNEVCELVATRYAVPIFHRFAQK